MAKSPSIESYLQAGLNAAMMRQSAIANNMANVQTPDYRRWDVKFEDVLRKELDGSLDVDLNEVQPKLYQPMNTPVNGQGNDVSMEDEVGQLLKNSGRYRTYMMMLTKTFAQMKEATQTQG